MPKQKFHYCLTCDRIVYAWKDQWHFTGGVWNENEPEQCYGPFTTSTPPELPLNWNEFVTEPSDEELEEMDRNGLDLMFDLLGVENV